MEAEMNATAVSPAPEPTVGSAYGHGWRQLWTTRYFGWLLLIWVIYMAINYMPGLINSGITWYIAMVRGFAPGLAYSVSGVAPALIVFNIGFTVLIVFPVLYGLSFAYLKAARTEKVEVKDMFAAFGNYWNSVGAGILVGIMGAVGFFLLIVPGIIISCKLAFVPYLVVDKRMSTIAAIKMSWRMTDGYAMKVFLLFLLGIPIAIAGLVVLGVGVIIAWLWISLALSSFYYAVTLKSGEGQEPLTA